MRTGCLIAIERETKLKTYIESGVEIDAKISSELCTASSIRNRRFMTAASSCARTRCGHVVFVPVVGSSQFQQDHRDPGIAALGLSEQTDAVVLIVSEETEISLAADRRFVAVADQDALAIILKNASCQTPQRE